MLREGRAVACSLRSHPFLLTSSPRPPTKRDKKKERREKQCQDLLPKLGKPTLDDSRPDRRKGQLPLDQRLSRPTLSTWLREQRWSLSKARSLLLLLLLLRESLLPLSWGGKGGRGERAFWMVRSEDAPSCSDPPWNQDGFPFLLPPCLSVFSSKWHTDTDWSFV